MRRGDNPVWLVLANLCGAYRQQVDTALRGLGLHVGQEQALMHLWDADGGEPLTQGQIASRMVCSAATVSNMVDRLERGGFVERRPDPDDARAQRVHLTERGRALETPVREIWRRTDEQLMAGLTGEERVLLHRLLLRVRANVMGREPE